MNSVILKNSSLSGTITAPPSKSAAHRALICSFLSGGGSVKPIIDSNDMKATRGVIRSIKNGEKTLNCIESGSTMRFMIPVAASLGLECVFTGEGSLLSRTLGEYLTLLPCHGVEISGNGFLPAGISGKLRNGTYEVGGDVSSQYITGLLLALSNVDGDSAVILTTPLQSKPYVDMTVKIMADYGVNVKETDFGYLIHGRQSYDVRDYTVEGDWSQAAFFLVAGAVSGDVTVNGLSFDSAQGDKAIVDVLRKFGCRVETGGDFVRVIKSDLTAADIDASDIPDLVPIISVLAAVAKGKTTVTGVSRLRYKESDRINSVASNLRKMGVSVTDNDDEIVIEGAKELKGARLDGFNDHRILMAFSVAALSARGETSVTDAFAVNKSYPSFFEDYNKLGGKANVL